MENNFPHHHFSDNNIFTIPVDDNYNLIKKSKSTRIQSDSIFIINYSTIIRSYLTYYHSFYLNQLQIEEKKDKTYIKTTRQLPYNH